jgi:hypothetical protein
MTINILNGGLSEILYLLGVILRRWEVNAGDESYTAVYRVRFRN